MGTNIYAPPAYNGLRQEANLDQYVDIGFDYVYDVSLTADQALADQGVPIQNDADFAWRALILADYDGAFQYRISDSQGYYLSNGFLLWANLLSGSIAVPYPIFPELLFPSGGRIGIDITDLSSDTNVIQLTFRGVKRYRVPGAPVR